MSNYRIRIDRVWHSNLIALWLIEDRSHSSSYVGKPMTLEMTPMPENFLLPEPTLSFPTDMAFELLRKMLDALAENDWLEERVGAKKNSIREHLADMRKINDRLLAIVETKL